MIVSVDNGCKDEVIHFRRISGRANYNDSIDKSASKFKKPSVKLAMRERRRRMESMAKDVIACCFDNNLFKEDPIQYLKGNRELANDISDFLDGVKENIENHMDVNFVHLDNEAVPLETNPTNENNERNGEEVNESSDGADRYMAAITILSDTTKRGYARILGDLKTQFKLELLPTCYQLTKKRPLMCNINIELLP